MNAKNKSKKQRISAKLILDTAVRLAEQSDWEKLRLHHIAAELNISLSDIQKYYREKEALSDAWFERANQEMLRRVKQKKFLAMNVHDRLHFLIMTWLETLSSHRKVTRQMICGKFEPGHVHVTFPALLGVSRTVQWMREAVECNEAYLERAIEETALTTIFLMTLSKWLCDDSENSDETRALLNKLLNKAARAKKFMQKYISCRCCK